MRTVALMLTEAGKLPPGFHFRIENPPWMPLDIEELATRGPFGFRSVSVAHYGEQNGEAIAQATGLRVLKAIADAVPVRLMKRDLLFLAQRFTAMMDERRIALLIRQHGMGRPKDGEAPAKLLAAFLPKADESTLGRILVESAILLPGHNQTDAAKGLRDAAHAYKVDVDAISAKVKQEFAAKEKAKTATRATRKATNKAQSKTAEKSVAA